MRRLAETEADLIRAGDLLGQARARRTEARILLEAATEAYVTARDNKDLTGDQRTVTLSELDSQRAAYQARWELSYEEVRQAMDAYRKAEAEHQAARDAFDALNAYAEKP